MFNQSINNSGLIIQLTSLYRPNCSALTPRIILILLLNYSADIDTVV